MEPLAEYVEAITAGREYPVFPHDADTERAASAFNAGTELPDRRYVLIACLRQAG